MSRIHHTYWWPVTHTHQNYFYFDPEIRQYPVVLLMITFAIFNIEIKFWTQINEMTQLHYLQVLNQPVISRQQPFQLTGIEYYKTEY